MSKLNIKVIQTCDEEKLLPSLMAISTKYALSGRTGETETESSGQKDHDDQPEQNRGQDQPEQPPSERTGR